MIPIQAVVWALVYVIILALVFWLLWWLVRYINPPEPFNKVLTVILAVAAVLCLISVLLWLAGMPLFRWGP